MKHLRNSDEIFFLLLTVLIFDSNLCLSISVAAEKDFVGASLVSVLHKLLSDERSAPEIKYNSMILICAVMGSGGFSVLHVDSGAGIEPLTFC